MSRLSKGLALLVGIAVFYAALLVALLCGNVPLRALEKAAICGASVVPIVWLLVNLVASVLLEGLRNTRKEGV